MKIVTTPVPTKTKKVVADTTQAASGDTTHVRHAVEGTDPKSGQKMKQVELTGCHTPQKVWFSAVSRVALPIKE